MIGPDREDGQLPEIGDRADSRCGTAVGTEVDLYMDEGLRNRLTNGVGPVARRETAGIEKHRHGCANRWPPRGPPAMCRLPTGSCKPIVLYQISQHIKLSTVCIPIGVGFESCGGRDTTMTWPSRPFAAGAEHAPG